MTEEKNVKQQILKIHLVSAQCWQRKFSLRVERLKRCIFVGAWVASGFSFRIFMRQKNSGTSRLGIEKASNQIMAS